MHIRKYIYLVLITLMLTNCSKFDSPSDLVDKSILFSDPDKKWENAAIGIEIREPRPQNPDRYSKVIINIPLEYFELTRNRGENTSSHIVTKSGANMILINGDDDYDNALLEEYGLSSEKNIKYKRYYEFLYGLPHSLKSDYVKELSNIEETNFNNQEAFALTAKLRKPIISNEWKIYFSKENHSILGLD
ncbi:MAG: DUF6503 family protein, partial [Melioribacteraceae bacterium]|nr:DUF6503 family protein [Melioribacteraceae bacterium]